MEQTVQSADSGAASGAVSAEDRVANFLFGAEQPEPQETEVNEAAPEPEAAQEQSDEQPAQQAQDSDDSEDVDYEGKSYRVPKEIKEALLRQSDYTRKTQEVAALREQALAAQRQVQTETQFRERVLPLQAQMKAIDDQLAQYGNLKVTDLGTEDLLRVQVVANQLRDQKLSLERQIGEERQRYEGEIRTTLHAQLEQGMKLIQQRIPNWSPEVGQKVAQFGISLGFTQAEMASVSDPRQVLALYNAMKFAELQQSGPAAAAKAASKPAVVKPSATKPSNASQSQTLTKIIKTSKDKNVKAAAAQRWFESKF